MAEGGEVIFKFLGDDKQLKSVLGGLGSIGQKALKGLLAGTAAVSAGFIGIVTASVKARGEMEQLEGGVKKIFDEMDYAQIEEDAVKAYKNMNLSARQYMQMINSVGATFSATMGDQKGYETAKKGLQAIADYASGTGEDVNLLNEKYKLISRSTTSYLRIADQFSSILPQTTESFLKQAQASGFLSDSYKKLTDVPVAEYQQAVTAMIEQGVDKMNLLGNTAKESTETLTGSIAMTKSAWDNFLSGKGSLSDVVDSASIALDNILRVVDEALPDIMNQIQANLPKILELGGKILMSLCDGIIEYMPQILDVVVTIVEKISDALLENSDKLGDIAFKLMEVFAVSIIKALPRVIIAMGKIGLGIIESITKLNGDIWVAGYELLLKFIAGVKNTYHQVQTAIEAVKIIIRTAINSLKQQAINWGRDFLSNFANGIMERLAHLREVVNNVVNSIRSKLHFSRPDEGPLRDYETWMPDMIQGMAKSLDKASPTLLGKVSELASEMSLGLSPSLNGNVNNSLSPKINVIVNNSYESDPLGQMVNQIKTFSNGAKNDYNYGYGG